MNKRFRKTIKRRRRSYRQEGGMNDNLRKTYGFVTLPKGTRLYHSSSSKICTLPNKPVLFMTLHPSEWYNEDSNISIIELQRDVELLFMVKLIRQQRIFSALNTLLGTPRSNLAKMNYNNIRRWLPYLQAEGLDGWFSSIENGSTVEFAIINTDENLKLISCDPIQFNWNNMRYIENTILPKTWGSTYPLSPLTIPIKFTLNSRFKPQIEAYIENVDGENYDGTSFVIMLKNSEINYFDAEEKTIRWE